MPTRNVNLTEELDQFITSKIDNGRYDNASEVVRAALRSLEREEQKYETKLGPLCKALEEGIASGVARGDVLAWVRRRTGLPVRKR